MKTETIHLASPSPGTSRHLKTYRFGIEGARPKVYIQAGLHADEWPGLLVIQQLIPRLIAAESQQQIYGEIVIVPFANPVGMSQNVFGYTTGRFDLAGTGNFNRNFGDHYLALKTKVVAKLGHDESKNTRLIRAALIEIVAEIADKSETDQLKKTLLSLSIDADYIFDLHCDDHSCAHIYAVEQQAEAAHGLCQALGFEFLFIEGLEGIVAFDGTHLQPWHRLRQEFPEFPIALPKLAVTVEYRGQYDVCDELAIKDAANLFNFLVSQGILSASKIIQPEIKSAATAVNVSPLSAVDTVLAESTGLLVYQFGLNTLINKGQVFAEIIQLDQLPPNNRQPVIARTTGYLMAMTHRRLVRPGDLIAKIAGQDALDHRQEGNLLQL